MKDPNTPKIMLIVKMGPSSDRLEPRLKKFQEQGTKVILISAFPESHNSKAPGGLAIKEIKL